MLRGAGQRRTRKEQKEGNVAVGLRGRLLIVLATAGIVGCAQNARHESVVICDTAGCAERDRNHALPPPPVDPATEAAAQRLSALRQMAEQDPRAAHDLGLRHFRGDGVRQDSHEALLWMRSAAERGELDAQKALGRFYLTGLEEMGADPREAEKWLLIAAGRGDAESEQLLAQATAAKRSEQAWHEWRSRWRPVFHRYWYSGYRYRTYWHNGYWAYY